ncbi:hypothetical protein QFC19_006220 [Naganishia cerealis]|uniref:Uncharacterized protein n=1 Tax=Naganishia cerealis TaxID=610337 RepID=A0ACC2VJZ9_9TREE|nr:hypothetical protein QFC19_006220 [Naganishia cerealis]
MRETVLFPVKTNIKRVYITPTVLVNEIEPKLATKSISLIQIDINLIDAIRPPVHRSLSPVTLHPLKFSGCSTKHKLALIRDKLFTHNPDNGLYILPVLPSVAWLLNLRCQNDVPNTPIFRSYVTLTRSECVIYADKRKFSEDVEDSLKSDGVRLEEYGIEQVKRYIVDWKASAEGERRRIMAPRSVSWGLVHKIKMAIQEKLEIIICPVDAAKAIKNKIEIEGFRRAYLRDGAATVRWMTWLDEQIKEKGHEVGEWEAGEKLTELRSHEQYFA